MPKNCGRKLENVTGIDIKYVLEELLIEGLPKLIFVTACHLFELGEKLNRKRFEAPYDVGL